MSDLQDLDLHGSRQTPSTPDWSEPPSRGAASVWLAESYLYRVRAGAVQLVHSPSPQAGVFS